MKMQTMFVGRLIGVEIPEATWKFLKRQYHHYKMGLLNRLEWYGCLHNELYQCKLHPEFLSRNHPDLR